jgi:signal transduction histidine kinase
MRTVFPNVAKKNLHQGTSSPQAHSFLQETGRILEKYHSGLLVALGFIFLALEIREHILLGERNLSHFISEVSLVSLLFGSSYILIRVLVDSLRKRNQAMEIMRWKYDLGIILSTSQEKDQVARRLVEQVHLISPPAAVDLYLHDFKKNSIQWIAGEQAGSENLMLTNTSPTPHLPDSPCRVCIAQHNRELNSLHSCRHAEIAGQPRAKNGHCLVLMQGASSIGMLHLHLPGQTQLPQHQVELLRNTSFEMANALSMAMKKKALDEAALAQKVRDIQLDIARDLHDTIGQNIAYLRLCLDRIAEDEKESNFSTAHNFQHMLEVANESYDLLRGTMAVLQSKGAENIQELFSHYAAKVSERSGINIDFHRLGGVQPQILSPVFVRQIFFVFREIMSNIEKHAHATHVTVETSWKENVFTLTVSDNGAGFDPNTIPAGHYGIRFINDRVQALNGAVSIQSNLGAGSMIHIQALCENC